MFLLGEFVSFFAVENLLGVGFIGGTTTDAIQGKDLSPRERLQNNLNFVVFIFVMCICLIFYTEDFSGVHLRSDFLKTPGVLYFKLVLLFCGIVWALLTKEIYYRRDPIFSLYPFLMVVFIFACFIALMSVNLFGALLSVEVMSILMYGFFALDRPLIDIYKQAFHFFILSAFFSGCMFLGLSFVYKSFGALGEFEVIHCLDKLKENEDFMLGAFLLLIGFLFKLGVSPFFLWVPNVFRNCPLTGNFVAAIQAKVVYVFLLMTSFNFLVELFAEVIVFFSILTLFIVIPLIIKEENIRALFGYSSVIQTSFLLLGLQVNTQFAKEAVVFFLLIYIVTMFMVFIVLMVFERRLKEAKIINLEDLKGFGSMQTMFGITFAVIVFSLAGIPPFPGFFGKVALVLALLKAGHYFAAFVIIGVTLGVMAYYIKPIMIMFSGSQADIKDEKAWSFVFTPTTITMMTLYWVFIVWFLVCFHQAAMLAGAMVLYL